MLHQNKGPGSLYIVKGGPDTIRYMDQRPLFDHIHQTNVLCKETYLAPIAAPLKLLSYVPFLTALKHLFSSSVLKSPTSDICRSQQ
nr:MAG TPA: hypothetical protein [Caudoviricetes sp.]